MAEPRREKTFGLSSYGCLYSITEVSHRRDGTINPRCHSATPRGRSPDDLLQSSSIDVAEGGVAVTGRTTAYHTQKVTLPKATLVIDKPFAFAIVDEQSQELLVVGIFESTSDPEPAVDAQTF
jgi:hypothetical protein